MENAIIIQWTNLKIIIQRNLTILRFFIFQRNEKYTNLVIRLIRDRDNERIPSPGLYMNNCTTNEHKRHILFRFGWSYLFWSVFLLVCLFVARFFFYDFVLLRFPVCIIHESEHNSYCSLITRIWIWNR